MAATDAKYAKEEGSGKLAPVTFRHGRLRAHSDVITYGSQAIGDTINLGKLPKGARVLYGLLTTSKSIGSSKLAFGVDGDTSKYGAAAAYTSTKAPTFFAKEELGSEAEDDVVELIATVSAAALPESGTGVVTLLYVVD